MPYPSHVDTIFHVHGISFIMHIYQIILTSLFPEIPEIKTLTTMVLVLYQLLNVTSSSMTNWPNRLNCLRQICIPPVTPSKFVVSLSFCQMSIPLSRSTFRILMQRFSLGKQREIRHFQHWKIQCAKRCNLSLWACPAISELYICTFRGQGW
jgi:hypothetical protein